MQIPLIITLIIITQRLILAIILFKITSFSWFSYIFLIVFLSGIIVLFAYVSSLTSNQFIKVNPLTTTLIIVISTTTLWIFIKTKNLNLTQTWINNNINNYSIKNLTNQLYSIYTEIRYPLNLLTIFLIILLLITLFVVIKNSKNSKHPLRLIN